MGVAGGQSTVQVGTVGARVGGLWGAGGGLEGGGESKGLACGGSRAGCKWGL